MPQDGLEDATFLGAEPRVVTGGNTGLGLGDVDGDGWLDLLAVNPQGSLALRNDGAGGLVADGAITVDGGGLPAANGVALGDLDGDGDLDAWLGRLTGEADLVLLNDGTGAFTSAEIPDSDTESFTGSLADLDGDGDLDLFVARYTDALDPAKILDGSLVGHPSAVYLGDGAGALVEAEGALPEEVVDDISFLGTLFDADLDGDVDIYLSNDFGPFLGRNRLLLNDGGATFSDAAGCECDRAMYAMGLAVSDLDGQGGPDLYITDLAGPDLLLSDGAGGWYDATLAMEAQVPNAENHLASWGTAAVDLDLDGHDELPMVFGPLFPHGDPDGLGELGEEFSDWVDGPAQEDVVLWNRGGERFQDVSVDAGFHDDRKGRALVTGDLDRDGTPDLVTGGLWYVQPWRTELTEPAASRSSLTLVLVGQGLVAGPGAHVAVTVEGRTLERWFVPTTTWSSSAPELTVGLGGAAQAEEVVISWVGGGQSTWTEVAAGRLEVAP